VGVGAAGVGGGDYGHAPFGEGDAGGNALGHGQPGSRRRCHRVPGRLRAQRWRWGDGRSHGAPVRPWRSGRRHQLPPGGAGGGASVRAAGNGPFGQGGGPMGAPHHSLAAMRPTLALRPREEPQGTRLAKWEPGAAPILVAILPKLVMVGSMCHRTPKG
jgi:hypothetical protein